jgi:AraC family transcriptional regulator
LNGAPGYARARVLAQGDGWTVEDVVCTCGPQDHAFEERHTAFCIAIVAAGTFQYRTQAGRGNGELMTPGSLLLGSAGRNFECGHEHGEGDRCLAFKFRPDYFESLAADSGASVGKLRFGATRIPPVREIAPLVAQACSWVGRSEGESHDARWEELGIQLAMRVQRLVNGVTRDPANPSPSTLARVTQAVRMIENHPEMPLTLGALAQEARLSRYHFLRTFMQVTGVTPHQFVMRSRLREVAVRLIEENSGAIPKVLDAGLDCGFGDASNFNRSFRAEFGVNPLSWRRSSMGNDRRIAR